MSRRHAHASHGQADATGSHAQPTSQPICRCGKPTPPGAYSCRACTRTIDVGLAKIAEHHDDLETLRTGQTRYGSANGQARGTESHLGMNPLFEAGGRGTRIDHDTRNTLVGWVRDTIGTWPSLPWPADTVPAMAAWLRNRLHAIAGLAQVHELYADVIRLEKQLRALVDRPADRLYAGTCGVCAIVGQHSALYARAGDAVAVCEAPDCGAKADVEDCRTAMRADVDARLCTAAEIARLATYLDLLEDRDKTRKRINQWHTRGVITAAGDVEGEPVFAFGTTVRQVLAADSERRTNQAQTTPSRGATRP